MNIKKSILIFNVKILLTAILILKPSILLLISIGYLWYKFNNWFIDKIEYYSLLKSINIIALLYGFIISIMCLILIYYGKIDINNYKYQIINYIFILNILIVPMVYWYNILTGDSDTKIVKILITFFVIYCILFTILQINNIIIIKKNVKINLLNCIINLEQGIEINLREFDYWYEKKVYLEGEESLIMESKMKPTTRGLTYHNGNISKPKNNIPLVGEFKKINKAKPGTEYTKNWLKYLEHKLPDAKCVDLKNYLLTAPAPKGKIVKPLLQIDGKDWEPLQNYNLYLQIEEAKKNGKLPENLYIIGISNDNPILKECNKNKEKAPDFAIIAPTKAGKYDYITGQWKANFNGKPYSYTTIDSLANGYKEKADSIVISTKTPKNYNSILNNIAKFYEKYPNLLHVNNLEQLFNIETSNQHIENINKIFIFSKENEDQIIKISKNILNNPKGSNEDFKKTIYESKILDKPE